MALLMRVDDLRAQAETHNHFSDRTGLIFPDNLYHTLGRNSIRSVNL